MSCWQQDSYFWQVLESIHKFIIELHVLECLFVRESSKNQRKGRITSIFTKGETFHLLWQPSALGSNFTMWPPFLHLKKSLPFPSAWPRREYTWNLNWKESLLICFENCYGVHYFHKQNRNTMMNTCIIVDITPYVRDKSMLLHSRKTFLLPSVWQGTEYTWTLIEEKILLICFERYQGIPYSHTGRVDWGWQTFC